MMDFQNILEFSKFLENVLMIILNPVSTFMLWENWMKDNIIIIVYVDFHWIKKNNYKNKWRPSQNLNQTHSIPYNLV